MGGEWRTDINPGYRTKVIKTANATIEINRPLLSEQEQTQREEEIISELKNWGKHQ